MPPFQGDPFATVVKEMRDRGIAWKDYAHGVRRGRELVHLGRARGRQLYVYHVLCVSTTTARSLFAWVRPVRTCRAAAMKPMSTARTGESIVDLVDGAKNSAMLMRHVENP